MSNPLASVSGSNLLVEWDRALNYAKLETAPIQARREHAARAQAIAAELTRRAATGDPRYSAFVR